MLIANVPAISWPVSRPRTYPRWPILILAASAFVAIWGGWVSLGRMCGFGTVNLLPGIIDADVDLSITLPLGMEAYAAWATGAWLTDRPMDASARRFAKWSALASLVVGGMGQVAYHLLAAAGVEKAPWPVVIVVACIPVAVLGMASQLAYRIGAHHDPTSHPAHDVTPPPAGQPVEPATNPDTGQGEPSQQPLAADPDPLTSATAAGRPALDHEQPHDRPVEAGWPAPASHHLPAGGRHGTITTQDRQHITRLAANGMSQRAIARELGRSRATIQRVLADNHTTPDPGRRVVALR